MAFKSHLQDGILPNSSALILPEDCHVPAYDPHGVVHSATLPTVHRVEELEHVAAKTVPGKFNTLERVLIDIQPFLPNLPLRAKLPLAANNLLRTNLPPAKLPITANLPLPMLLIAAKLPITAKLLLCMRPIAVKLPITANLPLSMLPIGANLPLEATLPMAANLPLNANHLPPQPGIPRSHLTLAENLLSLHPRTPMPMSGPLITN
ncbi:hypothetical protein PCASD_09064 [Puccinia coronata f. sp. avenae]|nr:hypothetical protein PCASD_09064 [Puccinia coronata f. sp. avenae]